MPLHPEATEFLASLVEQDPPGWQDLSPTQGREVFATLTMLFGEKPGIDTVCDYCLSLTDARIDEFPKGADEIKCRLFQSTRPNDHTVVYFHGGGFVLGNAETHDAMCRRMALATGATVISVEYRLSPEAQHPEPIEDCVLAVHSILRNSQKLGCGNKIVLAGDSAGGYLALATALRVRDGTNTSPEATIAENLPVAVVLIYPVVQPDFETGSYQSFATGHGLTRDTMRWFWQQYSGQAVPESSLGLLDADLARLPPTLVVTAQYDVLRDEGVALVNKLREQGNAVTHSEYSGQLHGFVHFAGVFSRAHQAIDEIAAFVKGS